MDFSKLGAVRFFCPNQTAFCLSTYLYFGIIKPVLNSSSLGENPWKVHLCWTSAYSTASMSNKELAGSELHRVCWIKPRTDKQLWNQKGMVWGLLLKGFIVTSDYCFFSVSNVFLSSVLILVLNFYITLIVVTYQLPNTWSCICMYQWIWRSAEKLFFQHMIVTQPSTCISFVDVFRVCAVEVKHPRDATLLQNDQIRHFEFKNPFKIGTEMCSVTLITLSCIGSDSRCKRWLRLLGHHGKISVTILVHADVRWPGLFPYSETKLATGPRKKVV